MPNQLYYGVKPYIPWHMRMLFRRLLARQIRRRCQELWPINPKAARPPEGWRGWPEGKQFAVVLTHDVEGSKGLDRCRQLMNLEQRYAFRSSFNLIPAGDYEVPAELREDMIRNGFEVGVHDLYHDGKLFRSRARFSQYATQINRYLQDWGASGFRSGFMHHELDWMHELEIAYDASTFDTDPFEPQPDGVDTIFPFWVAGPSSRGGYVELPYTLPQDSTMFLLLRERSTEIWKRKVDWIAAHGGMVLVDVHPDYMDFGDRSVLRQYYPTERYEELLGYIRQQYAGQYWHALPHEVAEFCAADKLSSPTCSHDFPCLRKPKATLAQCQMKFPLQKMNVADFASFERFLGQRVIEVNRIYWRQVRPFFYRPLLTFQELSPGSVALPLTARLGGIQFAVGESTQGNSSLHFRIFENAAAYSIESLDYNRRRQVKLAAKRAVIRPITDVNEFKQRAYLVYLSFRERTQYSYGARRENRDYFSRWADMLFHTPKILILGGYRDGELGSVSLSFLIENTLVYATFFCDDMSLRLHLPDLMLHSVREFGAHCPGVDQVFAGMYKGGVGLDNFYALRGSKIVTKAASLRINPFADRVLRYCLPRQYGRLWGRIGGDFGFSRTAANMSRTPGGPVQTSQCEADHSMEGRVAAKR
jgi:hypothetical protein